VSTNPITAPACKEPYKREDIMQKRPVILRSLLIVKRLAKPPNNPSARKLVSTNPITAPACKRVLQKRRYSAKET